MARRPSLSQHNSNNDAPENEMPARIRRSADNPRRQAIHCGAAAQRMGLVAQTFTREVKPPTEGDGGVAVNVAVRCYTFPNFFIRLQVFFRSRQTFVSC